MKKFPLCILAGVMIAVAATGYLTLKHEAEAGNNPMVITTMVQQGKDWLQGNKTNDSLRVACIYQKDVVKAQQRVDESNHSVYAKVYGETKLTPCILNDDATLADIQATALKSLNLGEDAVVGEIRSNSSNDFQEKGYTVMTVQVMAKKPVAS
jgi:hypothetical protein